MAGTNYDGVNPDPNFLRRVWREHNSRWMVIVDYFRGLILPRLFGSGSIDRDSLVH